MNFVGLVCGGDELGFEAGIIGGSEDFGFVGQIWIEEDFGFIYSGTDEYSFDAVDHAYGMLKRSGFGRADHSSDS